MLTPLQVLKKETQEFVPRSYWDMLRRGASQALFSDLAEVQPKPSVLLISSHGFYLSPQVSNLENVRFSIPLIQNNLLLVIVI